MDNEIIWNHLYEVLQRYADVFIERARQNMLNNGSNASGTLVDSIQLNEIVLDNEHFEITVNLADYWKYVNDGRRAGKFPPLSKIEEWIKVKHIYPQVMTLTRHTKTKGDVSYTVLPSVSQLAFLIGRKIANEGTQGTGFFDDAKKFTMDYFKVAIDEAINEDMGEYIRNVIMDNPIL